MEDEKNVFRCLTEVNMRHQSIRLDKGSGWLSELRFPIVPLFVTIPPLQVITETQSQIFFNQTVCNLK